MSAINNGSADVTTAGKTGKKSTWELRESWKMPDVRYEADKAHISACLHSDNCCSILSDWLVRNRGVSLVKTLLWRSHSFFPVSDLGERAWHHIIWAAWTRGTHKRAHEQEVELSLQGIWKGDVSDTFIIICRMLGNGSGDSRNYTTQARYESTWFECETQFHYRTSLFSPPVQ